MAIFKALTFDEVNSLDYGIYITGEAAYNAPERAVEMVDIPGKNGALALDQGRFENIEVTYHAGCFADNQADFADKVMKFRNALASRYTYKRLTDEYHPDEYRLGLYKSGLEVDAVRYSTAGEFNITFDCKPQRFLVDGDRAISPTEWTDLHTVTGDMVTVESDGSDSAKSLVVSLEPIQAGSGTPSPSNVRPISGRTEVVTQRTGKNLLNPYTFVGGVIDTTGSLSTSNVVDFSVNDGVITYTSTQTWRGVTSEYIEVDDSKSYVFSLNGTPTGVMWSWYDKNKAFISQQYESLANLRAKTPPTGAKYLRITPEQSAQGTYSYSDVQLELGTTATDYEPYQGTTYTTALGRTVYGGTLDVVSGVLTVDRAMVELNADMTWSKSSSYNGSFYSQDVTNTFGLKRKTPFTCSHATAVSSLSNYAYGKCYCDSSANLWLMEAGATVNDWKNYLTTQANGGTPVSIVGQLATPQTYQLTPQQVTLLVGENHVWSDGEITVEYGVHPYYNPTPFDAKPLIKVTGTGTLGIGEYILTITGTASQTLYIDCETMEIYTLEGTVPIGASSLVSINKNDFPVLKSGTNYISVGSGITAVTITPRWWRI